MVAVLPLNVVRATPTNISFSPLDTHTLTQLCFGLFRSFRFHEHLVVGGWGEWVQSLGFAAVIRRGPQEPLFKLFRNNNREGRGEDVAKGVGGTKIHATSKVS